MGKGNFSILIPYIHPNSITPTKMKYVSTAMNTDTIQDSRVLWEGGRYTKALSPLETPTDILRVINNQHDIQYKITFPKLTRAARRAILTKLDSMPEGVLSTHMQAYKGIWITILRYIHIWEYPVEKVHKVYRELL